MVAEHEDFYKRLRSKVQKWARSKEGRRSEYAEFVLLAPDLFHLLVRLSLDKEVATREKAKLAVAIAYFLSPVDLFPEWLLGPVGYLDDVGLAVFVLHSILEKTDERIVLRHWAGDQDLLETVRNFMERADRMLGSGLWGRLKKLVEPSGGTRRPSRTTRGPAQPARSDAARATERKVLDPTEKKPAKGNGSVDGSGSGSVSKQPTKKRPAKKAASKKGVAKKSAAKRSGPKKKTAGKKPSRGSPSDGDSKS